MIHEYGTTNSIPFVPDSVAGEAPHVFSVSGGKGGVGVTHTVINLAVEMQRRGRRVLVLDADLGLSNVPILLGLFPDRDLSHLLLGSARLEELLMPGPEGISILPGGFGLGDLATLTEEQKLRLICETENLKRDFDVVVVDAGAGISPNVVFFNLVPRHNIILVNSEASSLAGAYALMKILAVRYRKRRFNLILNGIGDHDEGRKIYDRLSFACHRLLNASLSLLGSVPFDPRVPESIRNNEPVVLKYPEADSSISLAEIADELVRMAPFGGNPGSLRFFSSNRLSPDQMDQIEMLTEHPSM